MFEVWLLKKTFAGGAGGSGGGGDGDGGGGGGGNGGVAGAGIKRDNVGRGVAEKIRLPKRIKGKRNEQQKEMTFTGGGGFYAGVNGDVPSRDIGGGGLQVNDQTCCFLSTSAIQNPGGCSTAG